MFQHDINVVLVDWSYAASDLLYLQSVSNSRVAGAEVAYLISQYEKSLGFDPSLAYLVGFSLGAQALGQTGKRFNAGNPSKKIGRITGNKIHVAYRITMMALVNSRKISNIFSTIFYWKRANVFQKVFENVLSSFSHDSPAGHNVFRKIFSLPRP